MATAVAIVNTLSIDAKSALILQNRLSLLGTYLLLFLFVFSQLRRGIRGCYDWRALPRMALAATVSLSMLAFTNFVFPSDIPWTHFVATFLLVSIMVLASWSGAANQLRYFIIGITLGLLINVRSFEAMALVIVALVVLLARLIALRVAQENLRFTYRPFFIALAGVALALLLTGSLSGVWGIQRQYGVGTNQTFSSLDLATIPIKLVQVFGDPCFFTYCPSEPPSVYPSLPILGDLTTWFYPLGAQLPLLISALLGCTYFALVFLMRRPMLLFDPIFAISILSAIGIWSGYIASVVSGSHHLQFGFFRDFMAPTWLAMIAFIRAWSLLLSIGRETTDAERRAQPSPDLHGAIAVTILFGVASGLVAMAHTHWPSIHRFHVADLRIVPSCGDRSCTFRLRATSYNQEEVPLPDFGIIRIKCYPEKQGASEEMVRLSRYSLDLSRCDHGASVEFAPFVMGFLTTPPDAYDKFLRQSEVLVCREPWATSLCSPDGRPGSIHRYALGDADGDKSITNFGWGPPEPTGRWTVGRDARLTLAPPIPAGEDIELTVEAFAFVSARSPEQVVDVFVNGVPVGQWIYRYGEAPQRRAATIPAAVAQLNVPLQIRFHIAQPRRPRDEGINADARSLGIHISRLEIQGKTPRQAALSRGTLRMAAH